MKKISELNEEVANRLQRMKSRGASNDVVSQPRMATRVLQNHNVVMTNAIDKNDMQYVSSAVVNDGFQTSFGESTLFFDVEETLWPNKGNGDSSIAIPTSSFPSLAEVSRSYTNSGGESCNEVNLVPSMFYTNSKSVCGMEGITPTGATGASNSKQLKNKVNFHPMVAEKVFDGVHISIPQKVVEKVSGHFENTLYDYFIGKRMALPVGGPWMIHNSPIILKKWSMGTSLLKEELTQIPIWVKLHDVPLQVFKDDGISLIASYLGKPIMLDSYTSLMCKDSWGRSRFARCLIEINLAVDFKESITIGIPDLEGPESCPKKVVVTSIVNDNNDGFQQVVNKRRNNKRSSVGNKLPKGVPVAKGFQVRKEFNYQPRAPSAGSNGGGNRGEASSKAGPSKDTNVDASVATKGNQNDRQQEKDVVDTSMMKMSNITTPNPFAALDEDEEEEVENI
ncbi:zinc knuckle CX2CX4HX4C containing protein [Tanacetum coccineum]